jgi:hypothetical protein
MTDYQDRWPKCINYDACGNRIYYRPDERTMCGACERRGGHPPVTDDTDQAAGGSDAQRVKAYLAGMTPEQQQWQITNLESFNSALAEQWRQWKNELAEEAADESR